MKRGKPLERKTRLRADPETTRAWKDRSRDAAIARDREAPKPATGAARRSRTARDDVPAPVRAAVAARAGGRCEARLPGCTDRWLAPHHRKRRSQGGPHTAENLVLLCADCHTGSPVAVHRNPSWAYSVGLMIRSSAPAPTRAWDSSRLDNATPTS